MFTQYIKNAFVNLFRYKFNAFIAVAGLAIAVLAALLLLSYSLYYLDYDQCVSDADEWYRIRMDTKRDEGDVVQRSTFYRRLLSPLAADIPEIAEYTTIWNNTLKLGLNFDGKQAHIGAIWFTDPTLLQHYPFEFIYSAPDSLLHKSRSVIISRTIYERMFGDENPLGKALCLNGRGDTPFFTIQGVFEDLPGNLHHRWGAFMMEYVDTDLPEDEEWFLYAHARVRIPNPSDVAVVREKLQKFFDDNPQFTNSSENPVIILDPITKIHFTTGLDEDQPTMNMHHLVAVLTLSGLFLLSALLNFVNLIVFTWRKRGAEFSSRRALGAGGGDLFAQLNVEYLLRYVLAVAIGLALYHFLFGAFSGVVQLDLTQYMVFSSGVLWPVVGGLAALGVLTSMLVSLRFAVRSVRSAEQLHRSKRLGSMLILALQVALSALFIVLGFIVSAQMRFVHHRDLGYDHANTVEYAFITHEDYPDAYVSTRVLLDSLRAIDGVTNVSGSLPSVVTPNFDMDNLIYELMYYRIKDGEKVVTPARVMMTYPGFCETRGLKLLMGEFPSGDIYENFAVNQTYVDTYFDGENPVGETLLFDDLNVPDSVWTATICGVVEDARFFPMHIEMPPMVITLVDTGAEHFQLTYDPARKGETLARVQQALDYFAQGSFLDYSGAEIDETLRGFYAEENVFNRIVLFCALVIAFISAMGVYSISSLYIQEQMKDIAVRKICGAGLGDVFRVYVRSFLLALTPAALAGVALGHMFSTALLAGFTELAPGMALNHLLGLGVTAVIVLAPLYLNIRKAYRIKPFNYLQNRE